MQLAYFNLRQIRNFCSCSKIYVFGRFKQTLFIKTPGRFFERPR